MGISTRVNHLPSVILKAQKHHIEPLSISKRRILIYFQQIKNQGLFNNAIEKEFVRTFTKVHNAINPPILGFIDIDFNLLGQNLFDFISSEYKKNNFNFEENKLLHFCKKIIFLTVILSVRRDELKKDDALPGKNFLFETRSVTAVKKIFSTPPKKVENFQNFIPEPDLPNDIFDIHIFMGNERKSQSLRSLQGLLKISESQEVREHANELNQLGLLGLNPYIELGRLKNEIIIWSRKVLATLPVSKKISAEIKLVAKKIAKIVNNSKVTFEEKERYLQEISMNLYNLISCEYFYYGYSYEEDNLIQMSKDFIKAMCIIGIHRKDLYNLNRQEKFSLTRSLKIFCDAFTTASSLSVAREINYQKPFQKLEFNINLISADSFYQFCHLKKFVDAVQNLNVQKNSYVLKNDCSVFMYSQGKYVLKNFEFGENKKALIFGRQNIQGVFYGTVKIMNDNNIIYYLKIKNGRYRNGASGLRVIDRTFVFKSTFDFNNSSVYNQGELYFYSSKVLKSFYVSSSKELGDMTYSSEEGNGGKVTLKKEKLFRSGSIDKSLNMADQNYNYEVCFALGDDEYMEEPHHKYRVRNNNIQPLVLRFIQN